MKRASIYREIDTFVLTMTGSHESSIVEDRAPREALFWPKMLKVTLKTPKNEMVTSCLRRKVFGGENDTHKLRSASPSPRHAIIWTNVSFTPINLGVVSNVKGESNLVELNVSQHSEAPVKRKSFSSNVTKFRQSHENKNWISLHHLNLSFLNFVVSF